MPLLLLRIWVTSSAMMPARMTCFGREVRHAGPDVRFNRDAHDCPLIWSMQSPRHTLWEKVAEAGVLQYVDHTVVTHECAWASEDTRQWTIKASAECFGCIGAECCHVHLRANSDGRTPCSLPVRLLSALACATADWAAGRFLLQRRRLRPLGAQPVGVRGGRSISTLSFVAIASQCGLRPPSDRRCLPKRVESDLEDVDTQYVFEG